ncbi:MAG: hypothetical protein OSA97_14725 [Nevskia sp.]|nr:hypothetical protein [Nevskia sp.]
MPATTNTPERDAGAELTVRYALLDRTHWHFQNAELNVDGGRTLASYPSANEAARLLGSELRPALARLKAVLDRLRMQFPDALTAEARLQRMSLSYLVRHYVVLDETGTIVCQWSNPALTATVAAPRDAGKTAAG